MAGTTSLSTPFIYSVPAKLPVTTTQREARQADLVTGFFARAYSPQAALLANGVLLAIVAVYFLAWQPQVRRL